MDIQYKVDIKPSYEWDEKARELNVSHRELEVLALVVEGYKNKEIAKILKIQHQSVKNHLQHLFKKLEVKTRQRLYTTSKIKHFNFCVTQNEYDNIDFLICYWFEKNEYFIVPKKELDKTKSSKKNIYYLKAGLKKDGSYGFKLDKYKSKWELILKEM